MSKSNKSKDWNKNKGKGKGKDVKVPNTKESSTTSCTYENDYLWYGMSEQLIQQFDSFSFDDTVGLPTHMFNHPYDQPTVNRVPNVGAIMQIVLFPTIGYDAAPGYSLVRKSAIVAACQRTYSILSASNGKTTKYLPEDIGLVILMLGNIISNCACFWRLYGIRKLFSPKNRLVPNALINAMGFNSADFLRKISDSVERYNNIIARLDGISMFSDIPYFSKCDEIYSHIFFDKGSAMGQYYITKPAGWFRYTDGELDPDTGFFTGNKLRYELWEGEIEINDFLDILENQVNDMLTSELFNLVYSDVVREIRRNGGSVYQLNPLLTDYNILPEFSEVFMTQIHNMTWGLVSNLAGYEITDDVNNLDLKDNLDLTLSPVSIERHICGDQIIDFPYTDMPDYKIISEALAYKTMCDGLIYEGSASGQVTSVALPDHAVYKVNMYGYNATQVPYKIGVQMVELASDYGTRCRQGWENFDVKPIVYTAESAEAADNRMVPVGELNYWTTITTDKMQRVFEQAFLRLFSPKFVSDAVNGSTTQK